MRFNEDPSMKEFGISVGGEFERVDARVLEPPTLFDVRAIRVNKGVWRANNFKEAMILEDTKWTILNLNQRTQEPALRGLEDHLKRGGLYSPVFVNSFQTKKRNFK